MTHLEILDMFYKDRPFYQELKELFNIRYVLHNNLVKAKQQKEYLLENMFNDLIDIKTKEINLKLAQYGILHAFI